MTSLRELWLDWRNRRLRDPGFQRWASGFMFTRPVAQRRARALFDICAGFVYSQVLAACVELGVFTMLEGGPRPLTDLARRMGLEPKAAERLLKAAASLSLLERLGSDRYALGDLGAAMLGNPGIAAMVAHHAVLYRDLGDPVALLRGDVAPKLQDYWAYAATQDGPGITGDSVSAYSTLMSASQALVAGDILDAVDLSGAKRLLDVGGGEGGFALSAAARHPQLGVAVFDLPPVAARAANRLAAAIGPRGSAIGGSFLTDELPTGFDVISLIRIVHDHDDEAVLRLLGAARRALNPGGMLIIGEPFAGVKGAEPIGDAYFGFYLLAMGQGRARTPAEIMDLLRRSNFPKSRVVQTRRPMLTGVMSTKLDTF